MTDHRARDRAQGSQDIINFAISSIDRVRDIAWGIIRQDPKPFCRNPRSALDPKPFCKNLRSALDGVKMELLRPNQSQDEAQLKKVKSLLNNLERLCNVRFSSSSSSLVCPAACRDVGLAGVRNSTYNHESRGSLPPPAGWIIYYWPRRSEHKANQWPTLKAIRSGPSTERARICLYNVAVEPNKKDYRADAIKKLKDYSAATWKQEAAEAAQVNDASVTSPAPHNSHELDDDIQYLYKILKQYRSCQNDQSPGDIVINLRLNGYRNLTASGASVEILAENASAEFGILLLDHPHKNQGFWQEASIQTVSPSGPEAPTVQVTDEDVAPGHMGTLAMEAIVEHDCIPFESFCERISNRDQGLLRMSTRDDKLVYHRPGDLSREWLPHVEAVPLASLFSRPDLYLLDKSKAILAMLAAKATWEFYDSDLLAQGLTSETVQFICEKRSGRTGVFINEPMLLTQYMEKDGTSTRDGKSDSRLATLSTETIHDMPRILALGILLLELETRKPMKTHRENRRLCPPGPFGINTDYKIACKLIATGPDASESIISDIEPLSPLRKILPLCITPGSLERKIGEDLSARGLAKSASQVNKQNALRSVIYNELVRPLEDWAKRYTDFDRIKPLYEVSAVPARHRPERPPIQPQTASPAKLLANVAEDKFRKDSQEWFRLYEELRDVLQPAEEEKKSGYKAVKIAVLDTGISKDLYTYHREWPGDFEYVDFVDTARQDEGPIGDKNTEHGTAAVLLLTKMCPNASYCVARVLKENVALQSDAVLIAKGIDWAIDQKVDIITMAIGFQVAQKAIVEAIRRAHTQGILIFSAASNKGRLENVYCPANMIEEVFGIFSTNAGIYHSSSLNPAPLPESFAVFGENIELEEGLPLCRGTSYSTSVAAGLAAALLDFSRQDRAKDDESILSQLGSRPHMRSVFREMAVMPRKEYLCLQPWSLLKSATASEKVPRDQQRDWIRGSIERWLEPNWLLRAGRF
ncbi:extracellular alkaline serine protease [Colletotrichum costaricense]|uniref:Extracellular alkaline serine protease n=1 Tax=Colletotrichum costaricense TaxID=1209916 RepID=A0AAJ0E1T7_9PEZI|nr:extracellular alkaline serine protease [Colletotrichum costaricense]KAK1528597.1 extracellular alkaline serine protease [Colletotrichum costaricense]